MGDASARPVISEKAHAECVRLLDLLINKRVQESWSWVFMSPVAGIPGYHDIIKKPMDLGTVKKNLGSKPSRCRFKSHEKFAKDVRLVFQNALIYNKEDEQVKGSVFDAAQHLLRVFENAYAKAIETVFADEDDGADHNSSTNEEQDATATGSTNTNGASSDKEKSRHSHSSRSSSSATPGHSHSSHSHASSDHESSKHKKDKSSKKEKKSKKSKKKSKDKDKERSSSSSSKDKDKDRERKSSVSGTSETHKKSHSAAVGSSSRDDSGGHKTASNGTHSHDRPASAPRSTETATASASSSKATATSSSSSSTKPAAVGGGSKMPEETMNACLGVLMKLIKYKEGNVSPAAPFLQPVDLMHFPDYKIKVPNRMHLYGVQKKLRSGGYATMDTFAYDVRLVFSNCLVYNSDVVLSKVIRSHAVTLIKLFEAQFAKIGGSWPGVSDRWKCHQIIHEILADRTDGLETAQWFKYPIETYFDSADQVPYGYFKTIKHPMDLGTVSSKLHLGVYRHVSELMQDLQLIFDNCIKYWSRDAHGMAYCESAKKLITLLKTQSSIVFGSNGDKAKDKASKSSSSASSSAGAAASSSTTSSTSTKDRKTSSSSASGAVAASSSTQNEEDRSRKRKHTSSNFPQKEVCMEILKALRQHKMKGYHDIEILTAGPFMHAVDVTKYPDYLKIVSEPMDLAKIERKLKGDRYSDVNEFSADVHLIFSNCHKYNSDPVEGADIRAMASNLRDYFADLYNEKLGNGEKSRSSTTAVATLPSAKLEASRSEPAPKQAVSLVVAKKPQLAASTKPVVPASSSASTKREQEKVTKAIAVAKTGTSSASASSSTSTAVAASASSSSSASASKSSTSQMTPHELEEYKKRKKEKKEKKEKKDKKKKDKKEKKKKDKDKKDKKDRDKSSHSRAETRDGATLSSTSSTVPASTTPSSGSGVTASSKPLSTSLAPASATAAAASHAARPSHVASKISPAESSSASASSKSKTKKSKKSDLSGWEALAERVLNRLVKIEQVTKLHFDRPLLEVFPELAQDYRRLVQEPMDLKTLREKLHDHSLTSATDFTRLGRLIFQNAIKFNCAPDPASAHVRDMSAHLQWYFESLCLELKLGGSSDDDGSKLDDRRRQRAERVNKTPMESKAKECQKLLRVLNSQKYDKNCWPFRKPVQVLFPTLPAEYYEIIKTPMDLATISEKLTASEYKVHGEFIRDVRLTFENAIRYNHADKDRDGWNVYSAATQMLVVVEEQWCDVTLEVMERVRRREIVRKERERLGEKRKGEKRSDGDDRKAASVTHARPASTLTVDGGLFKPKTPASASEKFDSSVIAKASVVIAPPSSKDDPESSTKLRLQIVNRPLDRMNKSERKAEEKRRKRARREEEMARSEKRRKTAVAATDDALREAEVRSRRRIQKMEIAEAVRQREERERQQREDDAAKSLAVKMKFNAASWTGQLTSGKSFWLRKPMKLQVPSVFGAAVDSY